MKVFLFQMICLFQITELEAGDEILVNLKNGY